MAYEISEENFCVSVSCFCRKCSHPNQENKKTPWWLCMILHVFDQRPLDFPAIPSHLNYFQVVVQHARILAWSWLFTQNSGSAILSQSWPLSAKKARHHSCAFWLKLLNLAENGWFGWKIAGIQPFSAMFKNSAIFSQNSAIISQNSAIFSHFGWIWLKMAENGWIFGRLKGRRFWLKMVQLVGEGSKNSANTNQEKQPFWTKPFFGLVALFVQRLRFPLSVLSLMFATKKFQRTEFLLQQHATRKSSQFFQKVPKKLVQKCKNIRGDFWGEFPH